MTNEAQIERINEKCKGQINRILIKGFKSIKECELDLKNVNVLIGANGAGKSNFISAFELLRNITDKNLSSFASKKGVNALLYKTSKTTEQIKITLEVEKKVYEITLAVNDANSLSIWSEKLVDMDETKPVALAFGGSAETNVDWQRYKFANIQSYHFHDAGITSKIKWEHNISNSRQLQWDGSNLAAFLYRLRKHHAESYKCIVRAIQFVAPYFNDFELEPMEHNKELIALRWLQKDCDGIFNASQLSDGTLRFICLATLLLQPTELQPETIIIDEPELGLHPFALTILAEMVQKASVSKQVILSTQSAEFLDHFEPEDVIVADKDENGSQFKRLDSESLADWLEDYSLGELWNKNVLGGRFAQ